MSHLGNGNHLGKSCVKSALIKTICSYITDCFILLQQLSLLKTGTTTVQISGVYWRGDCASENVTQNDILNEGKY